MPLPLCSNIQFSISRGKQISFCFSGTTIVPTSGSGAVFPKNGIKGSVKRYRLCRILA
jgi:hypothetical protein